MWANKGTITEKYKNTPRHPRMHSPNLLLTKVPELSRLKGDLNFLLKLNISDTHLWCSGYTCYAKRQRPGFYVFYGLPCCSLYLTQWVMNFLFGKLSGFQQKEKEHSPHPRTVYAHVVSAVSWGEEWEFKSPPGSEGHRAQISHIPQQWDNHCINTEHHYYFLFQ